MQNVDLKSGVYKITYVAEAKYLCFFEVILRFGFSDTLKEKIYFNIPNYEYHVPHRCRIPEVQLQSRKPLQLVLAFLSPRYRHVQLLNHLPSVNCQIQVLQLMDSHGHEQLKWRMCQVESFLPLEGKYHIEYYTLYIKHFHPVVALNLQQ
jgi:hypothetical protein